MGCLESKPAQADGAGSKYKYTEGNPDVRPAPPALPPRPENPSCDATRGPVPRATRAMPP